MPRDSKNYAHTFFPLQNKVEFRNFNLQKLHKKWQNLPSKVAELVEFVGLYFVAVFSLYFNLNRKLFFSNLQSMHTCKLKIIWDIYLLI